MTRADRLNALVARYAGAVHRTTKAATDDKPAQGRANYESLVLSDGRRRVVLEHPDTGDRMGVVGKDWDDCLAQLEAKLGAAQPAA